jgi:hypothetical protein
MRINARDIVSFCCGATPRRSETVRTADRPHEAGALPELVFFFFTFFWILRARTQERSFLDLAYSASGGIIACPRSTARF